MAPSVRALALGLLCGLACLSQAGAADSRRIELGAKKFEYSQKEIRVKKGEPVTFVVTAEDFEHGFSLPDFNVRADLIPGKAVEVTFTPDRAGSFTFLCDNFCGDDHEDMHGTLIVED